MSRSLISGSEHAKGAVSTALFLYAMIGNAPTFFYAPRRVQSTFLTARLRSRIRPHTAFRLQRMPSPAGAKQTVCPESV